MKIEELKVGDVVSVPLLKTINLHKNLMLADTHKIKVAAGKQAEKNLAICEVAKIIPDKPFGVLLLVPVGTGWPLSGPELQSQGVAIDLNSMQKCKTLQHNGYWIRPEVIHEKLNQTW